MIDGGERDEVVEVCLRVEVVGRDAPHPPLADAQSHDVNLGNYSFMRIT